MIFMSFERQYATFYQRSIAT